jgi:hypothetical protein
MAAPTPEEYLLRSCGILPPFLGLRSGSELAPGTAIALR